jgi:hypothetical protein
LRSLIQSTFRFRFRFRHTCPPMGHPSPNLAEHHSGLHVKIRGSSQSPPLHTQRQQQQQQKPAPPRYKTVSAHARGEIGDVVIVTLQIAAPRQERGLQGREASAVSAHTHSAHHTPSIKSAVPAGWQGRTLLTTPSTTYTSGTAIREMEVTHTGARCW